MGEMYLITKDEIIKGKNVKGDYKIHLGGYEKEFKTQGDQIAAIRFQKSIIEMGKESNIYQH